MRIMRKKEAAVAADRNTEILDELAGKTREVLSTTSRLSDFDVQMQHVNRQLTDYTGQMQDVSEMNLAVVEETTASMSVVNQTVSKAAENLKTVAGTAAELAEQNHGNQQLLQETVALKNEVSENSQTMSVNIEQLLTLSAEIDRVVASVQEIASQTNLLALNASIEAARAGEQGRGFAVVAEEVRQLAEDTNKNLENMRDYVKNVKEAAAQSKDSLQKTLSSTEAMEEKIEAVHTTVTAESITLKSVVEHIQAVDEEIRGITQATAEIDKAMEQNAKDAQNLSSMAAMLKKSASINVECATHVSEIDDELAENTRQIFLKLHAAGRVMNRAEFTGVLESAKVAHKAWIDKLKKMTATMEIIPLQTNGEKCAFGHFYRAVALDDEKLLEIWKEIGTEHKQLHSIGARAMEAILNGTQGKAQEYCEEAVKLSERLLEKMATAERIAGAE
ncbi:MAG: methyl-accepting chemotaxis protein [Acetatifactor sp.]